MATNEEQLESLDAYLDGELSTAEESALRRRLAADPALAAEVDQLRAGREARRVAFASMEGDDGGAGRVLGRVIGGVAHWAWRVPGGWVRYAVAAAACIVIGFVAGRVVRWNGNGVVSQMTEGVTQVSADRVYNVAITDSTGKVIAVQPFESIEQATEFSEDLERWQERQEQIRQGQVTVRSARF